MALRNDSDLDCTCSVVRGVARRLTQYYDEALKDTGLKVTQYGVMSTVDRMNHPSVTDLADRLELDRTTLTRSLSHLRQAGWVRLAPGPDKRTRSVMLTDAGRAMLEAARPHWREAETALRQRAGSDLTEELYLVLDQILTAVDRPAE